MALWQRLAAPFNESHYIRIYYVSSWFRSVSEFINMLNDESAAWSSPPLLRQRGRSCSYPSTCSLWGAGNGDVYPVCNPGRRAAISPAAISNEPLAIMQLVSHVQAV